MDGTDRVRPPDKGETETSLPNGVSGHGDDKARFRRWSRDQQRLSRGATMRVVIPSLCAVILAIAQALCIATILAQALAGRPLAGTALAGFALLASVRAMTLYAGDITAFLAGAAARRRLRNDAFARVLEAGPGLLRSQSLGHLALSITDRIEALDGFFSRWLPASKVAIAGPVLVALAALAADPVAGLILIATGLLIPIGMALSGIGAAAASRRQFTALTRLQARFLDRIRGIATIVLAGRAEDEARHLAEAADELRRRTMRVLRYAFLSSALLDCALAAALISIALRYAARMHQPGFSVGNALFVLLLVPEFFQPLRSFALAYQDRFTAGAAAETLLSLPPAPPPPIVQQTRSVEARGVAITFDRVGLTWDEARGPALEGLSFRVAAGETAILMGPSGSGKSTVIEILLGFVRPDSGRVTINGAPIETIIPSALAGITAWIGQRPLLFANTIRENIRFAAPDASDEQVERAAAAARVSEFARALPDGLDTWIGEGGYGLSGGQAQRVAIARAFLKDAPLLLLDEPTAHLDPSTEADVLASLRRLAVGRTVILATHAAAATDLPGGRVIEMRVPVRLSA